MKLSQVCDEKMKKMGGTAITQRYHNAMVMHVVKHVGYHWDLHLLITNE